MKAGIALVALAASGIAFAAAMTTPAEVAEKIRQPKTAPYILDVRTPEEFADGHVPHAVNIPLQGLGTRLAEVPKDRDVVVYCHSGARATRGAALLRESGYTRVSEMTGSLMAWEAAKLPLEK
jgi:phage shock protein E